MMNKIVFVPLDERPCNYNFPKMLYENSVNLVMPSLDILGDKKKEANVDKIIEFILKETKDAKALCVSLDMLLYGGLIQSRTHHLDYDTILKRLETLKIIKENNKNIKIYSSVIVMRCPNYSLDDEEPEYFNYCGKEIHDYGEFLHKIKEGIEIDNDEFLRIKKFIKDEYLNDFINRRVNNLKFTKMSVEYLNSGIIDNLIMPQDDSTIYGFSSMDQQELRDMIDSLGLSSRVLMYPGADESGMTLISKALMDLNNKKPKVYVKYASENSASFIPSYEDRPLSETVKYHILSTGGIMVSSLADADIVLCLTNNSKIMGEAKYQKKRSIEYDCYRNMPELIEFIKYLISINKPVMIADNAYANGGDISLIKTLNHEGLLDKLSGYAGWNTNGNTLGTAIAQGYLYLLDGKTDSHLRFLSLRYIEDVGYCSIVRFNLKDNFIKQYGYDNFNAGERRGIVSNEAKMELDAFIDEYLSSIKEHIAIKDCYMPWIRMFEIGLDIDWIK